MMTPKSKFLSKISTFKFSFFNYEFFKILQLTKYTVQLNIKIKSCYYFWMLLLELYI